MILDVSSRCAGGILPLRRNAASHSDHAVFLDHLKKSLAVSGISASLIRTPSSASFFNPRQAGEGDRLFRSDLSLGLGNADYVAPFFAVHQPAEFPRPRIQRSSLFLVIRIVVIDGGDAGFCVIQYLAYVELRMP